MHNITDNDDIVISAASDPEGFVITFESWVTADAVAADNIILSSASPNVGTVYWRRISGQLLTIGVKDSAGRALPAGSNDYAIAIQLSS